MSGTQVTGLVSCTRILKRLSSSPAPFMPSIWRTPASFCFSLVLWAAQGSREPRRQPAEEREGRVAGWI